MYRDNRKRHYDDRSSSSRKKHSNSNRDYYSRPRNNNEGRDRESPEHKKRKTLPQFRILNDTEHFFVLKDPERLPLPKILPFSEVECLRSQEISALRSLYEDSCKKKLKIPAPSTSFSRWLFEQLSVPTAEKEDPILCKPMLAVEKPVLKTEIFNALPASLYLPWSSRKDKTKTLNVLEEYCNQALDWIRELNPPEEEEKETMKEYLHSVLKWIDKKFEERGKFDFNESNAKFGEVKEKCGPFFRKVFAPKVDEVCQELATAAAKSIEKISNLKKELSERQEEEVVKVKVDSWNNSCLVSFKEETREITAFHHDKLKKLFEHHNPQESKEHFHRVLFVLACRYAQLLGQDSGAFHAAATESAFDVLYHDFEVRHENFASPFNCFFSSFNSAFPDIDAFFGSCGSFFDFEPIEGSFETGPPYTAEVIDKTAEHVEKLLENSQRPLSFVVFVPDWRDPPCTGLEIMDKSKFLVTDFVLKGGDYSYVVGHQHTVRGRHSTKARYFVLPFDTHLYFMQNEEGRKKWPVTEEKLERFKRALCSKEYR